MRKSISSVIFIGAAWGIFEATVGHFLHLLPVRIGWMVWFPIAFFFLNCAYRLTNKVSCMLYTAVISAGIKMIDIFYSPRIDYVINPAASIILEALAVFAVYKYLNYKYNQNKLDAISVLLPCAGWKVLYISYLFFLPESWINISCLSGMIPFAKFFFFETIMNTLMICIIILAVRKVSIFRFELSNWLDKLSDTHRILVPLCSVLTLILAIIVQIKL